MWGRKPPGVPHFVSAVLIASLLKTPTSGTSLVIQLIQCRAFGRMSCRSLPDFAPIRNRVLSRGYPQSLKYGRSDVIQERCRLDSGSPSRSTNTTGSSSNEYLMINPKGGCARFWRRSFAVTCAQNHAALVESDMRLDVSSRQTDSLDATVTLMILTKTNSVCNFAAIRCVGRALLTAPLRLLKTILTAAVHVDRILFRWVGFSFPKVLYINVLVNNESSRG